MDLYVGIIMQRDSIIGKNLKKMTVYRIMNYCLAEATNYFISIRSGPYSRNVFPNAFTDSHSKLVALPYSWEKVLEEYKSIDEALTTYNNDNIGRYVYFDDDTMIFIDDEDLLKRCRKVFQNDMKEKEDKTTSNPNENRFFDYQIEDKYRYLKRSIYGQDEALKIFLPLMIKNIELANSNDEDDFVSGMKANILLIGATGVGKTLMIKQVARLLNVPYVIEDANRYTKNGYSGEDVDNMLRDLYHQSNCNLEKAQRGILVIDEFDKLCRGEDGDNKIATTSVQQAMLKILEGSQIMISKNNHTDIGDFTFDTRRLTIILSGAFEGIMDIVQKRCNPTQIGFGSNHDAKKNLEIDEEDLIEYGMIPELEGRISNIIPLHSPTVEDLKNALLYSEASPLTLQETYFKRMGIQLEFDEEFIDAISQKAFKLNRGYRGLNKEIRKIIDQENFDLMSQKKKVLSLTSEKVK